MLKKLILCCILCIVATACEDSDTDASGSDSSYALLKQETLGAYTETSAIFTYDDDIYQCAYNAQRRIFRIQNTAQSRYMSCQLNAEPVALTDITISVDTNGIASFQSQEMEVKVIKKVNGKVWLWSAQKKIGLVIRLE